ncbi:type II toxin-antitoxin system HicA family toxin [Mycobacterium sp. 1245805.9]|uniref:type II toxin-antitoxin system HicA family toxin n=1 Tax=Mycobacterium sp. 1245805.9 TaxID=1856862 RepID=UPI0018D40B7D
MGKRFPSLKTEQLEAIVREHCIFIRRGKGSHRIYENHEGRRFPLDFHAGDEVNPILVRRVLLRDVGLTLEQAEQAVGI